MRIQTPATYQGAQTEINDQPSETIPNQAMTVKELIERNARGLPLQGAKVPMYEDNGGDFADLEHMELTDRMDYIRNVKERAENALQELRTPKAPEPPKEEKEQ